VLWQPVTSGKQFLTQFLRLKIASELSAETAQARSSTQQLRDRLMRGETIEIAGYELSPALALAIDADELAIPSAPARIAWLEVSTDAERELGPASRSHIEAWRHAGHQVDARIVKGNRFWQTVEICECAALVDATLSAVKSWKT
jgi:exosortase A-associated hydrolase 2